MIALTGATGFVGNHLLLQLTRAGWSVRALFRPNRSRSLPDIHGVEWVAGALDDDAALDVLLKDTRAVIHCAGAVRGANRFDFDRVNEEGARRIAQVAARQAVPPRLLLVSSLAAREPGLSHYAGSKSRGEIAIKKVSENLRWTIFRPPAVFGPGDRELLPLFQSMAKGFAPVPSNGSAKFSLIYVEDLASAVTCWLDADAGDGETFELDDGRIGGYDWNLVLGIAARVLRAGSVVRRVPIPISLLNCAAVINLGASRILRYAPMLTPGKVREIAHPNWLCDNKSISSSLDWHPQFDFEKGLARTFGIRLAT